jgi:hypothetical protein
MKIRPYEPHLHDEGRTPPTEGIAWWVHEGDRHVSHVITLDEVLGLEVQPDDDPHRQVARNALRSRLAEVLLEGLDPEVLADHVVWDREALLARYRAERDVTPDETEPWRRFDLNHRLAHFAFRRLGRRPGHEWAPGLSPIALAVDCATGMVDDRKPGDRSVKDRWYALVRTELQKLLSIVIHRLC